MRRMVARSVQFPRPTAERPTAGAAFFGLLTHPSLLGAVSQLLGSSEIVVVRAHPRQSTGSQLPGLF